MPNHQLCEERKWKYVYWIHCLEPAGSAVETLLTAEYLVPSPSGSCS